jgi:LysR family transcriptional regulator, low CO2-responsive transcriptional regulator
MAASLLSTKGITLHQMEVFEAVARHRNYTKAAAELYLTQPTVSIQIKQLSKTVGLPLVETIGRQLHLTAAGEALLNTCHQVLRQLQHLDQTLLAFQGVEAGTVKLATVESGKCLLVEQFKPFLEQYPGLEVFLHVGSDMDLQDRLRQNEDDFYLFSLPPTSVNLATLPYAQSPLQVLASQRHPLARCKTLRLADLATVNWILREPESSTRQRLEEIFAAQGLTLRSNLELSCNESIKASVAANLGLALLPAFVLTPADLDQDLAILSVPELTLQAQWQLAYRQDKAFSPAARAFLDHWIDSSPSLAIGA